MRRFTLAAPLGAYLLLTLAVGCAGAEPAEQSEHRPATSGDEGAAIVTPEAPPAAALGPVRSYVTDEHRIVLQVDMERVRASRHANDISSLVRSYPTWREMLGNSGIDPVRDFDRVIVAATRNMAVDATMWIRHRLTEADIRQRVLSMSAARGEPAEWRREDGFPVVDWPGEGEIHRVVVLVGMHELVVTDEAGVPRVLEVAADHRARREGDVSLEPRFELDGSQLVRMIADEVSGSAASRMQHPPESFAFEMREEAGEGNSGYRVEAAGVYASEEAAENARRYYAGMRDQYAGQMLVRAVGLDRPLREAVIAADGPRLSLDASFTDEEFERALGLVALGQLGGMGGG